MTLLSDKVVQVNRNILKRINQQISLRATQFANTLLSGIFRAIFHIEKAYEFSETETFQLEHDPERIIWSRLDAYQMSHIAMAIANEDVVAKRYQLFTEYDFIVIADVSRSMLVNNWGIYGGRSYVDETRSMEENLEILRKTKLYVMKYALTSFLHAARNNKFMSWVILFGGDRILEFNSKDSYNLEEFILLKIDEHFENLVESCQTERPMLPEVLWQVARRNRRSVILCLSDFMDGVEFVNEKKILGKIIRRQLFSKLNVRNILLPLGEIAYRHRILTLLINDWAEITHHERTGEVFAQENALQDVEIQPSNETITLESDSANKNVDSINIWRNNLTGMFQRLGVMHESLISGKDDDEIDRKIYRLGLVTEG